MDNQASRYKEDIIEVLLKRIIPLEKQLEAQTEIIDALTQSLETLTKVLVNRDEPQRNSSALRAQPRRDSLKAKEEQKLKEQKKKEADLIELKKAYVIGISSLKVDELSREKKESKAAGEPDSELEEELDKEEEQQIIDIELSQLADFDEPNIPDFNYSDQALMAIASLSEIDKAELYLNEKPPPKIRWLITLFWQVQGITLTPDKALEKWREFINSSTDLEQLFCQLIRKFDFSMTNLDKVEGLLKGRKNLLSPSLFNYSVPASHLMAIVRAVIDYSGVISSASAMRYHRLLYKKNGKC